MEELYWMAASSAESWELAFERSLAAACVGRARITASKCSGVEPAETVQLPPSRRIDSTAELARSEFGSRRGTMVSTSCCMPFLSEVKSGGAGLFAGRSIFL